MSELSPQSAPLEPNAITSETPTTAPGDASREYEFSEAQNKVIDSLTNGILWVRLPLFLVGFFQLLLALGLAFRLEKDGAHIVGILGHGLTAIVCFLLASWLLRAASAFIRVTTTTGHDIANLMTGIRNLAAWFDMLAFFVKLYLALLIVLFILLSIGLFAGAFKVGS